MRKIEFIAGYHEWQVIVDGEVIYVLDDFSDDITEDMTEERVGCWAVDMIECWKMEHVEEQSGKEFLYPFPLDKDEQERLVCVMTQVICQHYGIEQKRYRVVRDLQGGEFGMDRDLTVEQWREQAMDWAYMDENEELEKEVEELPLSEVIPFIANIWELEFAEVDGDGNTFQYEVNTVLNTDGEIDTSNTFATYEAARQFYDKIGNDQMKELLKVDDNGITIEEIESNYGH